MRVNRRQFGTIVAGAAMMPLPVIAAVDYGDPDAEFRDFQIAGVPQSGPFNPLRADGIKWCERLGLPHPNAWHIYRNQGLVQKRKLRAECHKWLADHSHRCTMADVI